MYQILDACMKCGMTAEMICEHPYRRCRPIRSKRRQKIAEKPIPGYVQLSVTPLFDCYKRYKPKDFRREA